MKQKKQRLRNPKTSKPKGISLPNLSKYIITPDGRVYSTLTSRYLRGCAGTTKYLQVWLSTDSGHKRWYGIHRLVAIAYKENPLNLPIAHHCDHNRQNNHPSNLCWVTQKQNIEFARQAGRWKPKSSTPKQHTPETRQKISQSKRGHGRGPYAYEGRTAETLKVLGLSLGIPQSEIRRLHRRGKISRILKP